MVIDSDSESTGFEKCLKNIENLLVNIYEENPKPKLSTKFLVLKSAIGYNNRKPFRYSKNIIKNLLGLLKEYSEWERILI